MIVKNIKGWDQALMIDFRLHYCGGCGFPFMVPAEWLQKLMNEKGSYHCPNGCSRIFTGPTEAQKIKELLEKERSERVAAERVLSDKLSKVISEKNKIKKDLNRVNNGVCPCCNRTFSNLMRHMKTKHPERIK